MNIMADHKVFERWPAADLNKLQLFSFPTANGVKASIALEEMEIPYEVHRVGLGEDVRTPEFLALNPNNKIPAIVDPNGPDGETVTLFESGAILIYLAEKTGKLLPVRGADRAHTIQWLMFQMGGLGPMIGQLGYFSKFAGAEIEDPRPRERFVIEVRRLLNVVDNQLDGKDWLTGEYSIADIATAPWLGALERYGARDAVGWNEFKNAATYLERFLERPAVQKGMITPPRD